MYYFSHQVNREVKEAYWQVLLFNLALSLVFIFEPIYLYTLGYSLIGILWFYVLIYTNYALIVGLVGKITSRIGYKHSIFLASIFYVAYWITLYSIGAHSKLFFIAPMLLALQKSFYWPPFNAEVALFDGKNQRGREVGFLYSLVQVTLIISPLIGGLVSAQWGFLPLFLIASALMLVSAWPLFYSPEIYTRHEFKYINLWIIFRRYKSNFFGYWGYGEDLMVQSLWPIYIFITVSGVSRAGAVATIATLIATVLMLYIGKQSDFSDKRGLLQKVSLGYSLTWIFRFFANSVPMVFLFEILTHAAKGLTNIPMVALTYEIAGSKKADFAIAYSVFYEFSLSIGKILTALGAILILTFTNNIFAVFALAGVMTLFYGFLKEVKR
jgi:MFS family permease